MPLAGSVTVRWCSWACLQDVSSGGGSNGLEAGNMLWLIQRDFLQGKTVSAMVADALSQQPNPHGDRDIQQVHAHWYAALLRPERARKFVEASWTLQTLGAAAKLLL
jgi:hypothetical protein